MDSGLEDIINASECEKLLVIAPSGLKAAKLMNERFGIPFEASYPFADIPEGISGRVLVAHQQFAANAIRANLEKKGCDVVCASWFNLKSEYAVEGDIHIKGEEDFYELAVGGGFDFILADEFFKRAARGYSGKWIDLPHFAVSGRLNRDRSAKADF